MHVGKGPVPGELQLTRLEKDTRLEEVAIGTSKTPEFDYIAANARTKEAPRPPVKNTATAVL